MSSNNLSGLITGYEQVGDHTEFIVQISCVGVQWLISRRYNDFDLLNQRLKQQYPGQFRSIALPEKQWFGRFDPNFLSKRQDQLQVYLDAVLQLPNVLEHRVLQHFLEIEKNVNIHDETVFNSITGGGYRYENQGSQDFDASPAQGLQLDSAERMTAIVEKVALSFLDVSQTVEPLDMDQALHRHQEIMESCDGFNKNNVDLSGSVALSYETPKAANARRSVDEATAELRNEGANVDWEESQRILGAGDSLLMEKFGSLGNNFAIETPVNHLIAHLGEPPNSTTTKNPIPSAPVTVGGKDEYSDYY